MTTTDRNRRVDNAAAVILDSDSGDILAMVGSPDYFDERIQGNVNGSLSLRQPGSAIKPFTYAAAMDPDWSNRVGLLPLTPASIIADLPVTFHVRDASGGNVPYQPLNYDRLYHGPVSVRTALANSYNVPAVKVLDRIGVETLRSIAMQAGISSFTDDYGLALTLGGGEVTLLELTSAYGLFGDGRRLEPRAILDIQELRKDGGWQTIRNRTDMSLRREPPGRGSAEPIIAPATAYLITDILSDPVARLPAFGPGSALELPFPAAVKTGTTTDWRDNWTVGYSTERIVGVWVGNADNAPMLDVSGIDGAGPIWHDLMIAAHKDSPAPFVQPPDVVDVVICGPSGMLPSPACQRTRVEKFISGTEPDKADDQFQTITVDVATGKRATADTPAERRADRTYWVLGPEYVDWMVEQGIALAPPVGEDEDVPAEDRVATFDEFARTPIVLTAPVSHTAYQIHPGVPRSRQRIEVSGYVQDGTPWAELRLIKDGTVLLDDEWVERLRTWWIFEEGEHHFWIEGRLSGDSLLVRSEPAIVQVNPFGTEVLALGESAP